MVHWVLVSQEEARLELAPPLHCSTQHRSALAGFLVARKERVLEAMHCPKNYSGY